MDTLAELFRPHSVAVIGATSKETFDGDGWLARLIAFGFSGPIYPINPHADKILGIKTYARLMDVPGPIDWAIVNVRAENCAAAIEECVAKGVKTAHIFSAGFSESGQAGGEMETRLLDIIRPSGVRILGPNAMGLYAPSSRLTFDRGFPQKTGHITLVSQSGSVAMRVIREGARRGLEFNQVVSYGNAIDIDEAELAGHFSVDKETEALAIYIEGARNEAGLMESVEIAASLKPVVILIGGTTSGGGRAVIDHTGPGVKPSRERLSMIPGVVIVESLEEMVDCLVCIQFLDCDRTFRRAAVVGRGAGLGVLATDLLETEGFVVPKLPSSERKLISEAGNGAPGTMLSNPIEPPGSLGTWAPFLDAVLPILDGSDEVDCIVLNFTLDIHAGRDGFGDDLEAVAAVLMASVDRLEKPIIAILASSDNIDTIEDTQKFIGRLVAMEIPAFVSVDRAAKAIMAR